MIKAKIAVIEGLGFTWLDSRAGQVYLIELLRTLGVDIGGSPYHYADSQGIHDFLRETVAWRGIIGDSFGADYGPQYAGEMKPIQVDYCAGFQPSMYADDVRNGVVTVPSNVKYAHCIRDPVWADTGGLGFATWKAENPKETMLIETLHRGAHPDDTGPMQNLIFAEVKHLIGA